MELLQFAGAGLAFLVIVFLWLKIVYLPARTAERWKGKRPGSRKRRG